MTDVRVEIRIDPRVIDPDDAELLALDADLGHHEERPNASQDETGAAARSGLEPSITMCA